MTTKSLKEQLRIYERMILLHALHAYPTRVAAAKSLNISLRTLFYKLRSHDLQHSYQVFSNGRKKSIHRQKFDTCVLPKSDASC